MAERDQVYVDLITETQNSIRSIAGYIGAITGAIVAVKKIYQTVQDLTRAYQEEERATRMLSAAIRATGQEAAISVVGLGQLASALQETTIHADDAIKAAMGMVQQLANLDEQGLRRIIPQVLDFADAMGVDLQTAASLVGKTLGSTTNALSRYGIVIDATADKETKLAQLTAELQRKFGDMSKQLGDTDYGAAQKFTNAIGDLKEALGERLSINIANTQRSMLPLIQSFKDAIVQGNALHKVLSMPFTIRAGQFEEARKRIEDIDLSLTKLRRDISTMLGERGILALAVHQTLAILGEPVSIERMRREIEMIEAERTSLVELLEVMAQVPPAQVAIDTTMADTLKTLTDGVAAINAATEANAAMGREYDRGTAILDTYSDAIITLVQKYGTENAQVQQLIAGYQELVKQYAAVEKGVSAVERRYFTSLESHGDIDKAIRAEIAAFKLLDEIHFGEEEALRDINEQQYLRMRYIEEAEAALPRLILLYGAEAKGIQNIVGVVKQYKKAWQDVADAQSGMDLSKLAIGAKEVGFTSNAFKEFFAVIMTARNAEEAFAYFTRSSKRNISELLGMVDEAKAPLQDIADILAGDLPQAFGAVGQAIAGQMSMWEALKSVVTGTIAAIIRAIAGQMIAETAETWMAVLKGNPLVLPAAMFGTAKIAGLYTLAGVVESLQHGGIVTRPTMALIGEAGPEAVVPLGRSAGIGGTMQVTNVYNTTNVAGNILYDDILRARIRGEMAMAGRGY